NAFLKAELSGDGNGEEDRDFVPATVQMMEATGADSYVYALIGETRIIARTDPEIIYRPGDKLLVGFNMNKVHFFDENTGISLAAGGDEG
ncbi:TOBE domain-containing protein, partial [Paenibacillus sepulcri]|nr:TOBE domain-containing protein [Paenibacillus sepulcri]